MVAQTLRFKRVARNASDPADRSVFLLSDDSWDDYGSQISFGLTYVDEVGGQTSIGTLKILQRRSTGGEPLSTVHRPALDPTFSSLGPDCISLGQSEEYYLNLRSLGEDFAVQVVEALRDVAWQPALATPFETAGPFRNGLLRSNSAKRAHHLGRHCIREGKPNDDPSFEYEFLIQGAEGVTQVEVKFAEQSAVPGRVAGIIGRNAVGKTQFMAQLASDLAQTGRISPERLADLKERFGGRIPLFNRVLAISYSSFDRFRRPPASDQSSYIYCGVRDDNGRLSAKALADSYLANLRRVKELGRHYEWREHIDSILGEAAADVPLAPSAVDGKDNSDGIFDGLSSGQATLCHLVTGLLAWVQPHTVVLFDEPETHLHPNAVANLFIVFSAILRQYESVAIIATHSPVVIQEIPRAHVVHFKREGNFTTAESLGLESFGESITELTRHVFETVEVETLYKTTLARLARTRTLQEVLDLFPEGLSLNAQAYLLARYKLDQQ